MFTAHKKTSMPSPEEALPGRNQAMPVTNKHIVLGKPIQSPFPGNCEQVLFGMGCFWGAEKRFWEIPGIFTTAAGYAGGFTPNPTYEEVCSGMTGHNEVVLVVYHPTEVSFGTLLARFWESHDPTQGMQQGNDRGTQYRSGVYCSTPEQLETAKASQMNYQQCLLDKDFPAITTEIREMPPFYYAEDYHQQYLAKNPQGYCGVGGTGVKFSQS